MQVRPISPVHSSELSQQCHFDVCVADDRVDSHGPTPLPPYRDPSNSSQGAISVSEDSDDGSDTECPSEGNSTLRRPVRVKTPENWLRQSLILRFSTGASSS